MVTGCGGAMPYKGEICIVAGEQRLKQYPKALALEGNYVG